MLVNCDVPITFPSFGQFRAIGKPDSGCMVCKTYFLLIATFVLQKLKTELKTSTTALILLLWIEGTTFVKNADIRKIKRVLELKAIFFETKYMCVPM